MYHRNKVKRDKEQKRQDRLNSKSVGLWGKGNGNAVRRCHIYSPIRYDAKALSLSDLNEPIREYGPIRYDAVVLSLLYLNGPIRATSPQLTQTFSLLDERELHSAQPWWPLFRTKPLALGSKVGIFFIYAIFSPKCYSRPTRCITSEK